MVTDISLKHQISESRYRDFLAEAERQRAANIALAARPRRDRFAGVRTAIAMSLLRAGSWLLPNGADRAAIAPATGSLQLRTCR